MLSTIALSRSHLSVHSLKLRESRTFAGPGGDIDVGLDAEVDAEAAVAVVGVAAT